MMDRRKFIRNTAMLASALRSTAFAEEVADANAPTYKTDNQPWQAAYDRALSVLAGNVRVLPHYDKPVLIEGSDYAGVWMECGPHESLVYRKFRPDLAHNGHMTFFTLQREDGQLPASNKLTETGFGQIQMVVPIAATAWELAEATGDEELLHTAYKSCSRWDDWLLRYRNTRGTGLTEGFCVYDTGMDNSRRWEGMPQHSPGGDAKVCPPVPSLPRLCPDLSATTYGARVALAAMADAMGKSAEAAMWTERAEHIRKLILERLYVAQDAAFYDLDAEEHFVRINCCILTRMCGEHVVDQHLFDDLWTRQIHNPKTFWAPYPFPSVALDDPLFVRPIPRNSWGGASQALTALRAGRWFDHYGRPAEFSTMMDRWCEAMQRDPSFRQQIDPLSGDFTQGDKPNYSPASLVMFDYTWRLSGIHEERQALQWNVRLGHASSQNARFSMRADNGLRAEMQYASAEGYPGCDLRLAGSLVAQVRGGTVRLVTDKRGAVQSLVGIHTAPQRVQLRLPGQPSRTFHVRPNERIPLSA
jgi:hypothetical protein